MNQSLENVDWTTLPERFALDLELARPLPGSPDRPNWSRFRECGISVCSLFPIEDQCRPILFGNTEQQAYQALKELTARIGTLGAGNLASVVTWNGVAFDFPMIEAQLSGFAETVSTSVRQIDLAAIAGLYSITDRRPNLRREVLTAKLSGGVPVGFPTLVQYKPGATGNVLSGFSLVSVARATLGIQDAKNGHTGAWAPEAWQRGEYDAVIQYCNQDALVTYLLWVHAWVHGFLVSEKHGRVDIPRVVL